MSLERIRKRKAEDEEMLFLIFPALYLHIRNSSRERIKRHSSVLYGKKRVREILNGHVKNCRTAFRMEPEIFRWLASYLRNERLILDSRIKVEEKLAFFLYMLSHNATFEDLQLEFQHSGFTFHKYISEFFSIIPILSTTFLRPRYIDEPHPKISMDNRFFPYFKNCIGAIDGTHVPITLASEHQAPWRNRKGTLSHNVMIACDFDLNVTFISCGWEGSATDEEDRVANQTTAVGGAKAKPKKIPKMPKRSPKKSSGDALVGVMQRFVDIKEKESKKEDALDFSITRCMAELNALEGVTPALKVKCFDVFKCPKNCEIFINAAAAKDGTTLAWLQSQIAG